MSDSQGEQNIKSAFSVYIIESPSPKDLYEKKLEGEILCKALSLAGIHSSQKLTVDADAFSHSLTYGLYEHVRKSDGLPPILHISSHGNKDGLLLTSNEIIEWIDLKKYMIPINKALNGNLILCLSSCEGFSGCKMAMTEGEIPFLGLISHKGKPTWSDTSIGFATFYHLLAKGYSIPDAVIAMRKASGDDEFVEILASRVQQAYIENLIEIRSQIILTALKKNKPPIL